MVTEQLRKELDIRLEYYNTERTHQGKTCKEARQDVFDYIEFIYNPKRKHGNNGMLSPIEFERQQKWKVKGV